jgi:RNA 3'-terminal phosphate cyclase
MSKTDHVLFAAKEILRDALEHSGVTIISHGFCADRGGDVSFTIHDKTFVFTLTLTEVPTVKVAPLPPVRARRALAR